MQEGISRHVAIPNFLGFFNNKCFITFLSFQVQAHHHAHTILLPLSPSGSDDTKSIPLASKLPPSHCAFGFLSYVRVWVQFHFHFCTLSLRITFDIRIYIYTYTYTYTIKTKTKGTFEFPMIYFYIVLIPSH